MNYYDQILKEIENLIVSKNYDEALDKINEELKAPYIPADVENKLLDFKSLIPIKNTRESIDDDKIIELLKGDNNSQLYGVSALNEKNLRNYLDIIEEYLCGDGFINAKVLLIDSLIRQEINEYVKMKDNGLEYEFIPKYVMPVEISDGFVGTLDKLNNYYMKEPSKLLLAKDLLYKECILRLPINVDENDIDELFNKVTNFIDESFR